MSDYLAVTHDVQNQPRPLENYNLYGGDLALTEGVARRGAGWAANDLADFGAASGTAEMLELGHLANKFAPEFDSHDRFGHRVDLVRFHPSYHQLMSRAIGHGLHSSPWSEPKPGAHVARAACFYMQSQVEPGHGCPITMTFASVAALRRQPDLAKTWLPKITARSYDPRNIRAEEKSGLTVGMAMTEKQGGSDVRANKTRAIPQADGSYELVGHKYFVSAPMCDLFLVLAQAPGGLTCFLLPRWRPDGVKNPLQIQRLKNKMGNRSNASSETELRGALAWRVGEEGRGVPTILEMVALTRFDCMIGSSAGMRMAAAQALFHCGQRSAFGKRLIDQPLMQNVLADLTLESEASLALTLRLAHALDRPDDPHEAALLRLATAIGKYWICKRTPNHAYEAMECIGGSGVMEDGPMPRLFRESPVNAIWEGSGNVQCLDVLRALGKSREVLAALFAELAAAQGANAVLDRHVEALKKDLADPADAEFRARDLVDRLAVALQASLLVKDAPAFVADPFIASRLAGQHHYGALPRGADCRAIIERGMPAPL
jgi:putative acyl-CoA dehydrogenase